MPPPSLDNCAIASCVPAWICNLFPHCALSNGRRKRVGTGCFLVCFWQSSGSMYTSFVPLAHGNRHLLHSLVEGRTELCEVEVWNNASTSVGVALRCSISGTYELRIDAYSLVSASILVSSLHRPSVDTALIELHHNNPTSSEAARCLYATDTGWATRENDRQTCTIRRVKSAPCLAPVEEENGGEPELRGWSVHDGCAFANAIHTNDMHAPNSRAYVGMFGCK